MADLLKPDLCVIGAGAGGLAAASSAAALGAQVVLVERGRMGGDELKGGSVASKSLTAAAWRVHAMARAHLFGLELTGGTLDFARVRDHLRDVMAALAQNESKERYVGLGVRVIEGSAKFIDPRTVAVGETIRIKARRFVIATGSSPVPPAIVGLDDTPYVTTETVFDFDQCPERLVVIGASPAGLELAQALRRLGAEVTVLDSGAPLAHEDPECAQVMIDALTREGIAFRTGIAIDRVAEVQGENLPAHAPQPREQGLTAEEEDEQDDEQEQAAEEQAVAPALADEARTDHAEIAPVAVDALPDLTPAAALPVTEAPSSEPAPPQEAAAEITPGDVPLADAPLVEVESEAMPSSEPMQPGNTPVEVTPGDVPLAEASPGEVVSIGSEAAPSIGPDVIASEPLAAQSDVPQSTGSETAEVQTPDAPIVLAQPDDTSRTDATVEPAELIGAQMIDAQMTPSPDGAMAVIETPLPATQACAVRAGETQILELQGGEITPEMDATADPQSGEMPSGALEAAELQAQAQQRDDARFGDAPLPEVPWSDPALQDAAAHGEQTPGLPTLELHADEARGSEFPTGDLSPHLAPTDEVPLEGAPADELPTETIWSQPAELDESQPDERQVSEVAAPRSWLEITITGPDGESAIVASHLLLAGTRRPNVEGLGLEAARIDHDSRGIRVDHSLKTTNKRVFAIGDVTGTAQSAHAATYHAGLVVRNVLFRCRVRVNEDAIPRVVFTDPQLAQAGITEQQARDRGHVIRVLRWPYRENDRARIERETTGHIKVVTATNGRILGATIVGANAAELVSTWVLAISQNLNIHALAGIVVPYPTLAEIAKQVSLSHLQSGLTRPLLRRIMTILRPFR